MKKLILIVMTGVLCSGRGQEWSHSFKDAMTALPPAWQSEQVYVNRAPALLLNGENRKPDFGNYVGHSFYLFKAEAQKLANRKLCFLAKVRRLEGHAPLQIGFRIFGNGNQFMLGRSMNAELVQTEQWENISFSFAVPELAGIENLNITLGFQQDGAQNNCFVIDEPELRLATDGGTRLQPADSIGMAALLDQDELVLVSRGIPQFAIILGPEPDAIAQYAAQELQEHVRLATGQTVTISQEQNFSGTGIWIGDNAMSRKYGVAPALLPLENWLLARVGSAIIIAGGELPATPAGSIISRSTIPLGTLSATYEFLERLFEARWYWPGSLGTVVPKADDVRLRHLFVTGAPAYSSRSLFYDLPKHDPDVTARDTLIWQRRIRIGGSEPDPIGMHSFQGWSRKYANHPEYFALQADGNRKVNEVAGTHLCLTNPDVIELAAKEAIDYFRANPNKLFFAVMPGDSNDLHYCRCPECQKQVSAEKGRSGMHSNAVWGFVNAVAAKVAIAAPGKYLKCCSYADYTRRPDFPLQNNIAVTLCFGTVPHGSLNYKSAWRRHLDEWRPTGAKLYVWEYWNSARYGKGVHGAPAFFPRQLKEIHLLDRNQVSGRVIELSDINSEGQGVNSWADWIYDVQNLYFSARLMWNANLDVDAELAAFFPAFYGPAASLLREFYDHMELAWTRSCYHADGHQVWDWEVCWQKTYPPAFVDRMMGLLRQAVEVCAGQEPYQQRAQKTLLGFLPFETNSRLFRGINPDNAPAEIRIPALKQAPRIDGNPTPDEWQQAAVITSFEDSYRVDQKSIAKTEIFLAHDSDCLYLAASAAIPPEHALTRWAPDDVGQRDGLLWNYESMEIFLAGATAERYQFIFAPEQKIFDSHWPDDSGQPVALQEAMTWNSQVRWATRRDRHGWQLEVAIPLAELTFAQPLPNRTMRVNFARNHYYRATDQESWQWEQSCWQPSFGSFHNVDRFAPMHLDP